MHISTKCSIAVHCLIFICEYGQTTKVTSDLLALSTGINPVTIRNIVSALKKEEILSVKLGTGGTTVNCPLNEITLYRIYKSVEPDFLSKLIGIHNTPSPFCLVGRNIPQVLDTSYGKIRNELRQCLQSITLEQILEDYHNLEQKELQ
ncbi:MAG: Rrf2 family transcriptional regulator [Lachnospiraceae bacterium]|jgi:DNA-binding IscR family transcriptional regulator|nr:Rrf2 family transcriptional regulator [Lachnospiraceae bacterium]